MLEKEVIIVWIIKIFFLNENQMRKIKSKYDTKVLASIQSAIH